MRPEHRKLEGCGRDGCLPPDRPASRGKSSFLLLQCASFVLLPFLLPPAARAGMPSPLPTDVAEVLRLTDAAHARFEAVSFFAAVLLISAAAVKWLWNRLAGDLPRLPRLTYGKSLAVVGLWGLLFLVVLTLIAGTRELMTPGIWQKQGLLYQVPEASSAPGDPRRMAERKGQIERLKAALWQYAATHDGRFPPREDASIPATAWEVPGAAGLRYLYVPGRSVGDGQAIVAWEPSVHGEQRFALRADGEIMTLLDAEIRRQMQEKTP